MHESENKSCYRRNVAEHQLPLFLQPWWLDIVCEKGRWDVCLAKDADGKIIGVLPYYIVKSFGVRTIRMPPFTPYLGIWLDYSGCSDRFYKRYSFETKVIGELIDQLPKVIWYHQIHPEQLQNWLPFYWRGFKQSTRYTYVLNESDPERVFENMKGETRTRIRKAGKLFSISENNNVDDL